MLFCHFFVLLPPNHSPHLSPLPRLYNPENQNFGKKKWKKMLSYYTYVCAINKDHVILDSWNIKCDRQKFLSFWTIFYPFSSLATWKIKTFRLKKTTGNTIILYICTINNNHMMYGSWDMERIKQFFVILDRFLPFGQRKSKFSKNEKKHLKILSFCKCVP